MFSRSDATRLLLSVGAPFLLVLVFGTAIERPVDGATSGTWRSVASMSEARSGHLAFLLQDGRVLVVGGNNGSQDSETASLLSAELFDPVAEEWSSAASMRVRRSLPAGTELADGRVLVVGGFNQAGHSFPANAEIYDPATDTWTLTKTMTMPRFEATATLLMDGRVLVTGGGVNTSTFTNTSEIYDPQTNQWSAAAPMAQSRYLHAAIRLEDGRVLIAGGGGSIDNVRAEIYDPLTDNWAPAGVMNELRANFAAVRLRDGRVFVAGGQNAEPNSNGAEIYDPSTNLWSAAPDMSEPRGGISASLLSNGDVLVGGGLVNPQGVTSSSEVYDSTANVWSSVGNLQEARYYHTSTTLADGRVLVTGGLGRSAEMFMLTPPCPREVTSEIDILQSFVFGIPFTPLRFQWVLVHNKTAFPISGPVGFVMDDLQRAVFISASLKTSCFPPGDDPVISIPVGDDMVLGPNESVVSLLWFYKTQIGPLVYTPRVQDSVSR